MVSSSLGYLPVPANRTGRKKPSRPPRRRPLQTPAPEDVFALVRERRGAAWLDGAGWDGAILVWDPVDVASGGDWADAGRRLARPGTPVVGWIGYEAGHRVEAVPVGRVAPEPASWLGRYEGSLVFRDGAWQANGTPSFRAAARRLLDDAVPLGPVPAAQAPRAVRTVPQAVYEQRVRQILAYIAEGDCYQVNLTRPVHLEGAGDAWSAWRRLRAFANAGYAAYLSPTPELAILSSSPELFLRVDGRRVASLPIKGTRPRHPDPVVDHAMANELRRSEKDRAELTMIVDLVRNDLGRVAVPGSVTWDKRRVTAHANVHHAAQRVEAVLEGDHDTWDALAATFPPGSVTGAPKVRACQRIVELEDEPRGVYCGAIGFVDGERSIWNVAIRTAVWTPAAGGSIRYHVGGGIVADSDPAAEWWETVHKGTVMARAFAGAPRPITAPGPAGDWPARSTSRRAPGS